MIVVTSTADEVFESIYRELNRQDDMYLTPITTVTYTLGVGIDHGRDPGAISFVSWAKLPHVRREARRAHLERKRRRKKSGR